MSRGVRLLPPVLLLTTLAEVVVFVLVGRWVGFGWAVLLVLLASLLGLVLTQREGIRAWRGFRAAVGAGHPPGEQVIDGLVGLAAGLMLAVPGLLTGAAGLLLVAPPVRAVARRRIQRAAEQRVSSALAGDLFGPRRVRVWRGQPQRSDDAPSFGGGAGPVIDGEVHAR